MTNDKILKAMMNIETKILETMAKMPISILSIYTKSEKTNISNKEIISIIQHYKQE